MSKVLLVDASAFITLADVGRLELIQSYEGEVIIQKVVAAEITEEPGASWLEAGKHAGWLTVVDWISMSDASMAAAYLGNEAPTGEHAIAGDTALLAEALSRSNVVVVTDDKPLRKACKALGIPVSGSIGIVIAAVERGDLEPEAAKDVLVAMDEVGARLSASLLRRAERLIEAAADRSPD